MYIVKLRYLENGEPSGREYAYFSEGPLAIGDMVRVPVLDHTTKAQVSAVDVPENEIAGIRHIMRTILLAEQSTVEAAKQTAPPETSAKLEVEEGPPQVKGMTEMPKGVEKVTEDRLRMLNPTVDESVIALQTEAFVIKRHAESMVVDSVNSVKQATDDLAMVTALKKAIEEKRQEYVGPLNRHLKEVNEAFRLLTDPLTFADKTMREKVMAYRAKEKADRETEERINAMRIEAAQEEMQLRGDLSEPVDMVAVRQGQPDHYRAQAATAGTRKQAKFEVVDFAALPDEYKLVDASKLGRVVRAGALVIPGVRIWQDDVLTVTSKKGG